MQAGELDKARLLYDVVDKVGLVLTRLVHGLVEESRPLLVLFIVGLELGNELFRYRVVRHLVGIAMGNEKRPFVAHTWICQPGQLSALSARNFES